MVERERLSREKLNKAFNLFVEPDINMTIESANRAIKVDNDATRFVRKVMHADRQLEHHILDKCVRADTEEGRSECILKTEELKKTAINRFSEILGDACDLKVAYVEED